MIIITYRAMMNGEKKLTDKMLVQEKIFRITDPKSNVWVNANAGSGKTYVLTRRVIRLLFNGVLPSRILCLTHTKKAAAEMKERIFATLASWVTMDQAELIKELQDIEPVIDLDEDKIARARQLFALAQDIPGGLKIQTIHSFCESILHQFCIEADMAQNFNVREENFFLKLKDQALLDLIENDVEFNKNLAELLEKITFAKLAEVLDWLYKNYNDIEFIADLHFNQINDEIKAALSLKTSPVDILKQATANIERNPEIKEYFADKNANWAKDLDNLESALKQIFLTKEGKRRTRGMKGALGDFQEQAEEYLDEINKIKLYEINRSIYEIAAPFIRKFKRLKNLYAAVSYDDLLFKTYKLLKKNHGASWVNYKLDQSIDHILVDEAQDTSPTQWKIIKCLMDEFFAGQGQKEQGTSCFAVGDVKQAIYGFQGSKADDFINYGIIVENDSNSIGQTFERLNMEVSYRSQPVILAATDQVLTTLRSQTDGQQSESHKSDNIWDVKHIANKAQTDGYVEIWQLKDENDAGGTKKKPQEKAELLAISIGEKIADLIENEGARPGDIMILINNRTGNFANEVTQQLKNRNIEVSGIDRLELQNHIAIMDLCALSRFCLSPYDDLNLANICKSPLFGLSEQQLYELAASRSATLWQELLETNSSDANLLYMREKLNQYIDLVNKLTPFEFFSHILEKDGGRRRFRKILGGDVDDILDEFLNFCLKAQYENIFSMQSFLGKIAADKNEITREVATLNKVSISTVHGAKGLEAPIVFLVENSPKTFNYQGFYRWADHIPIYVNSRKNLPQNREHEALDKQAEELKEYQRLLYVAMTRAKDKLFYSNIIVKNNEKSWAKILEGVFCNEVRSSKQEADFGTIWRYNYDCLAKKSTSEQKVAKTKPVILPACLLNIAQDNIYQAQNEILDSSHLLGWQASEEAEVKSLLGETSGLTAADIGIIVHRILQYIPQFSQEQHNIFIDNFLSNYKPQPDEQQKSYIKQMVLNLLSATSCAALWSQNSRAEIAIAGKIGDYKITGRIDRLVELKDEVLFCDYKTGKVPNKIEDIPKSHLVQIAVYQKLLHNLYSDKPIKALLIYTRGIKQFYLSPQVLTPILDQYLDKRRYNNGC